MLMWALTNSYISIPKQPSQDGGKCLHHVGICTRQPSKRKDKIAGIFFSCLSVRQLRPALLLSAGSDELLESINGLDFP